MANGVPVRAITLEPRLVERVWGSQELHPWYPAPQPEHPVGEVWLTAEECVVTGGASAGRTLNALATLNPDAFGNPEGYGFPLLIKMLYPREKLSVQVHPDDSLARATLNQMRGKTECWYIVSAEPGAAVAVGFAKPMSPGEVREAIADGTLESKLAMLPVRAGDMVFVDAGTIHAIGPGVVVLETQQYSDITYRLWDYNRGRDLHIEPGLKALRTETAAGLVPPVVMGAFDRLVSCAYFSVDRFHLGTGKDCPLGETGKLQVLIALGEGAQVQLGRVSTPLPPGRAVLLPAGAEEGVLRRNDRAPQKVDVMRILGPED